MRQYSMLNDNILEKWYIAARLDGVPEEAYKPRVKIVSSKESGYSFGVIHNEHRFKRLVNNGDNGKDVCSMCKAADLAVGDERRNLQECTGPKSRLRKAYFFVFSRKHLHWQRLVLV